MIATLSDLLQLSHEGGGYFKLALQGVPELACEEIVRRIPDRRLVCRGMWNGRLVYAKLFMGIEAQRYAARDVRGARALMAAHIATPPLLHEGDIASGAGRVLIYAAISPARNAEEAWQASDAAQRGELVKALVRAVAQHHAAGLLQTDLYLRNFLCAEDAIYTLDGDGIRIHRSPLGQAQALSNLALLLSKFDVMDDARLPELLRAYTEARGWINVDAMPSPDSLPGRERDDVSLRELHAKLQTTVRTIRRQVARQYAERKVLRDCSDVRVEQDFWRFQALERARQSPDLAPVIADPDAWLDAADCLRLKNGNTCTVGLVHTETRKVVIKRYNVKNFWHGVGRLLRRTRACVSWSNAHLLQMYGIATPPPLALIELRWGGLRRQSYFLAEYVAGPDLAELFADPVTTMEQKQAIAVQMAILLRKLCLLGIEHGDMKASNFLLVDGAPVVIDLDAMQQHGSTLLGQRRHARDLRRFLRNWQHAPETLQILKSALVTAYGSDPVLAMAGVAEQGTSEST